jgi:hypothetical protein
MSLKRKISRTGAWLQWYSACLASAKSEVQTTVLKKEKRAKLQADNNYFLYTGCQTML